MYDKQEREFYMKKHWMIALAAAVVLAAGGGAMAAAKAAPKPLTSFGDVTESVDAAIQKAVKDGVKTLVIPQGTYTVKGNVTVPESMTLSFDIGAMINVEENASLEILGTIKATPRQIFGGNGKIFGNAYGEGFAMWFGPISGNATKAVQRAVDTMRTVQLPYGAGTYTLDNINFTRPVTLIGTGGFRTKIASTKQTEYLFNIASDGVSIGNLYIEGNAAKSNESVIFYLNNSKGELKDVTISNVWTANNPRGLSDAGSAHPVSNLMLDEVTIIGNRNTAMLLRNVNGGTFRRVALDNCGWGKMTYPTAIVENAKKLVLEEFDILGGRVLGTLADGITFRNCDELEIVRAMVDTVDGACYIFENVTNSKLNNLISSIYNEQAFIFRGCENIQGNILLAANIVYVEVLPEEIRTEAVLIENCKNMNFKQLDVSNNQTDGLVVDNSSNIVIETLTTYDNRGTAYVERNGSNNNTVKIFSSRGNRGNFVQCGSNSLIMRAVCGNGSVFTNLKGAVSK